MRQITVPIQKNQSELASYAVLRERLREEFAHAQQGIDAVKARTYWNTGWYISRHVFLKGGRAAYGKEVLKNLESDLGRDESILGRCRQIYDLLPDEFQPPEPIPARVRESGQNPRHLKKNGESHPLPVNAYLALITVADDRLRFSLRDQARRYGWTGAEVAARVNRLKLKRLSGTVSTAATQRRKRSPYELLVPKKGKIGIYQIIEARGRLHLDKGFTGYVELDSKQAKRFHKGDFVSWLPGERLKKVSAAEPGDLFTYEAGLDRVIDADSVPRKTAQEMRAGPPEPIYGNGFQSALSGFG